MKTCNECQSRLSAYLDGEAGDQTEAIRAHLEACDACRRMLVGLWHLSSRIRDAAEEEPPTLLHNIRSRVRAERSHRLGRPPIRKLAAAAVIAAAFLWTVVLLGNSGGGTGGEGGLQLSDLARGSNLSETEQRILFDEPPTDDELLVSILSGGSPR